MGARGQGLFGQTLGSTGWAGAGRLGSHPTWRLVVEPPHLHGVRGMRQQGVLQPN